MRATARLNTAAPMLWATLAFAAGIAFNRYAWRPPLWWMAALAAGVIAAVTFATRGRRISLPCALVGIAALGAVAGGVRTAAAVPAELAQFDGARVLITGHVVRDDSPEIAGQVARRDSFDLQAESLQPLDAEREPIAPPVTIRANIQVSVYGAGVWDDDANAASARAGVHYGQRLRFPGSVRLPRNFGNPGSFDYRQYLLDRGIVALASTRADRIEILPGWNGSRIEALRSRMRGSVLAHIGAIWPAAQAATLDSMLVSERSLLDPDLRTAFQRTGIYHLLVVAGLHLGIIACFVYWLARRMRLGEWPATALMMLAAVGFAWMNDDGAPVWRATLMLGVYMLTRLLYRERAQLNAIGVAALALLLVNPQALFTASFQLSFVAVLSIAAVALPVVERTSAPWRRAMNNFESTNYDAALAPRQAQFRLDLRLLAGRLSRFVPGRLARAIRTTALRMAERLVTAAVRAVCRLWELIVVSSAMQLCLALPMAWYFHRAITLGLPANLVAVPLAGVLLPMALAAIGCSYLSTTLAKPFAYIAGMTLRAITGSAGALLSLHGRDRRHAFAVGDGGGRGCIRLLRMVVAVPARSRRGRNRSLVRLRVVDRPGAAAVATAPGCAGVHGHRRRPGRIAVRGNAARQDAAD